MDMRITTTGTTSVISFSGNFTFLDNAAFKEVLNLAEEGKIQAFTLDFSEVTFIDSSVLGMMMILRNITAPRGQSITLRGVNGQPEKVMRMSQFDSKFTMT